MPTIFNIEANLKGQSVNLSLKTEDFNHNDDYTTVSFIVNLGGIDDKLDYEFSKKDDSLKISPIIAFGGPISCIAGCAIALAGPIYDCWKKSKGVKKDFLKCLEENKGALSTGAYVCVINCIA